jgi:hypothetical protein
LKSCFWCAADSLPVAFSWCQNRERQRPDHLKALLDPVATAHGSDTGYSRQFARVGQGELHQGMAAVQVELVTDVPAVSFDSVVADK